MSDTHSSQLTVIKQLLTKENVNPDLAIEFFCKENDVESKKNNIRNISKNKCYFFTKKTEDKFHIIALININIKSLSKESQLKDIIKTNALNDSSFTPKTISFFGN